MKDFAALAVLTLLLASTGLTGQEGKKKDNDQKPVKEDAAHEELREVKKAMEDAFNKKDVEALLKHVHKDVVVTWQNGDVSRGHKGVKDYYDRMLTGDKSVLEKVDAKPEMPELSILYGSPPTSAIAFGELNDKYKLRDGTEIDMKSRFSATVVKEDGKWLIVNFHGSAGVFDNAVLKLAVTKTMWMTAGVVGIAALILGLIVGRLMGGKKA